MTVRRAALAAALVAALVSLPSVGNRFALDDGAIVERNATTHSLGAAWHGVLRPYWPPEHGAGLWRPLVILSFAADWEASRGNAHVMHATNVALHAAVTALVVLVLAGFLDVWAALAGGLLFAVHPVHVEAVANLVGRAELLAALFLLAAVLVARAVRRRAAERKSTLGLEAALLLAVAGGLLSKEHAVVAVAWLWLDDRAKGDEPHLPPRCYVSVVVLTVAWFLVRRHVEGGLGFHAVAPTFFNLGARGRIYTMLPAVLVMVRLLVWPVDLSPDYHPQVIERLEHLTAAGVAGLILLVAVIALAVALWRRNRIISVGLLALGVAWLPTSNLLFPSGIVLAERTLYLPSIGLALVAAAGVEPLVRLIGSRRGSLVVAIVCAALAVRSWVRIPVWRSTRDLVLTALLEHPESYKVHQSAARVFWRLNQRPAALAEYRVAEEIYPLDPYMLSEFASAELEAGSPRRAVQILRKAERLDSNLTVTQQLLAEVLLRFDSADSALVHARRAVAGSSSKETEPFRLLASSYLSLGLPDSAIAVWPAFEARGGSPFERWLMGAVTLSAAGRSAEAQAAIERAISLAPADSTSQRRLAEARAAVGGGSVRAPR